MATTIVKRAVKGSPLTVTEHDANHQNVADTADGAVTAAAAANTNANTRAPGGALIAYSGAGRSLVAGDNGNVIRCSSAGAVSMTVPSGLPGGFSCVIVQGGAGLVTAVQGAAVTLTAAPALVTSGFETDLVITPAGTDAYTVYSPEAAAADGIIATIAGARGTGNTLSATVDPGWMGTFQWQRQVPGGGGSWTDIAGQVASSTVELIGDVANHIRCLFLPTAFYTNTLAAPPPGVADNFTRADGVLGTASDGVAWAYGDDWRIKTNSAQTPFTPGTAAAATSIAHRANAVGATFSAMVATMLQTSEGPGLVLRYVDESNFHFVYADSASGGIARLYKVVAGVFSLLGSSAPSSFTVNSVITMLVGNDASSGDITFKVVDGTSPGGALNTFTDATNKAVATVGLYVNAPVAGPSNLCYWKNFSVSA